MSREISSTSFPQTEIILDNRYRIIRKIGEGGFGVTYEAQNLHSEQLVAIKEQKHGDISRFLREARVLRDYADDSHVVTVLDYFEENGKAYLVMEYLEGQTLAEEIRKNGKWPTEKAVRAFVPIMRALERMHTAGVIHRDISPDNLMVRPDGTLVLMDFGAVKQENDSAFTKSAIYKPIYSPPEQREVGITANSTADIYALAATMYFAITGTEPEDVLSRLLFDELKKPSEAGSDILPLGEEVILSCMELRPESRIQSIHEMREALEAVYPDLTEEEKKKIASKKIRRKKVMIGAFTAVLLIIAVMLWAFRVQIRLSIIESSYSVLDGSHMSPDDFKVCADNAKRRFTALANEKLFIWKEDPEKQQIYIKYDSEIFKGKDPKIWLNLLVALEMQLRVSAIDDKGKEIEYGEFSQTESIHSVVDDGENLIVVFTDDSAERLADVLFKKDVEIKFYYSNKGDDTTYIYDTGLTIGDGKSVMICETSEESGSTISIPDKYTIDIMTHAPSPDNFVAHTEWKIRWEDPYSVLIPGKNQKKEQEIPGKSISFAFQTYAAPAEDGDIDAGSLNVQGVFKNRMDSLGIPYAIGVDIYNPQKIIIKVGVDSIYLEEMSILGDTSLDGLYLGSRYAYMGSLLINGISVVEEKDGSFCFSISVPDYSANSVMDDLKCIESQSDPNCYLYFEGTRLASCPACDAVDSVSETGNIIFREWEDTTHSAMDKETIGFARFLKACKSQRSISTYHLSEDREMRDEKGKIVFLAGTEYFPRSFLSVKPEIETNTFVQDLNDIGVLDTVIKYDLYYRELSIRLYSVPIDHPEEVMSPILSFLQMHQSFFEDGSVHRIELICDSYARNEYNGPYAKINWKTEMQSGKFKLSEVYVYSVEDKFKTAELEEAYEELAISFP